MIFSGKIGQQVIPNIALSLAIAAYIVPRVTRFPRMTLYQALPARFAVLTHRQAVAAQPQAGRALA